MQSQFINQVSKEYGRRLLPSGSHKVSKKQQIINSVLAKARRLAKSPLTGKQANSLQRFVADRLSTHGRLGLKVALKEAVTQGADKISWTTGEQQNR